ncbi:MAG: phosphatase PAP2 family protein [Actinobacteria bacterium]|nr:phosphatase PAP2 family protein [Actinomycetota bacterium]
MRRRTRRRSCASSGTCTSSPKARSSTPPTASPLCRLCSATLTCRCTWSRQLRCSCGSTGGIGTSIRCCATHSSSQTRSRWSATGRSRPPRPAWRESASPTPSVARPRSTSPNVASAFYNPYAAVPSMHIGFSLLVGVTIVLLAERRLVRIAGALYPLFVLFVIVATGNHFFLDAAAGALVAILAGAAVLASVSVREAARAGYAARAPYGAGAPLMIRS